jgi:hypothetical protein
MGPVAGSVQESQVTNASYFWLENHKVGGGAKEPEENQSGHGERGAQEYNIAVLFINHGAQPPVHLSSFFLNSM